MAGDWIKIEHGLPFKEEVFGIARSVGQTRAEVVGRLIMFWSWADENSIDGTNLRLTSAEVDELVGVSGFAAAMRAEGWLAGDDGSLQLPNFQRHNGASAKARALETEAKRLRRLSDKTPDSLSDNCPTKHGAIVRPQDKTRQDKTEDIHGPCLDHVDVKVEDVEELASRVFSACGYNGRSGGNLWKAAAATRVGKISEDELWDACRGAAETATDPPAVVYTRLDELLARRGAPPLKKLFAGIHLVPKWPKSKPHINGVPRGNS